MDLEIFRNHALLHLRLECNGFAMRKQEQSSYAFFVVLLKENRFTTDTERIQEGLSREAWGHVPTCG